MWAGAWIGLSMEVVVMVVIVVGGVVIVFVGYTDG